MAQSINTSYAVIVLGDHGTLEVDDLAEKAAEQGAVIAETYSFEPGEPAGHDDLADVEAVVTALSRAIATGANYSLAISRERAQMCSETVQRLLGYSMYLSFIGFVNGRDPIRLLRD